MSDCGPEFSSVSVIDLLYYFHLFRKLNLDILRIFTYTACYSAFQATEHLWAPLSHKLSVAVFSSKVEKCTPPELQGELTELTSFSGKKLLFNPATMILLKTYWLDFTLDGNNVDVKEVFCGADQIFLTIMTV